MTVNCTIERCAGVDASVIPSINECATSQRREMLFEIVPQSLIAVRI